MRFRRALVLGAHPDDEMGCAGLVFDLASSGTFVEAISFSRCSDLNDADELEKEWRAAYALLGVDNFFVHLENFPNRRLPEHGAAILATLDMVKPRDFDLVLCPSSVDQHQDHATVSAMARRAFRYSTILGYELPLNNVGATHLTAYHRLDEDAMEAKIAHAACFASQASKPYMKPSFIEGLAAVRGVQAGFGHAEAYEVIRWLL